MTIRTALIALAAVFLFTGSAFWNTAQADVGEDFIAALKKGKAKAAAKLTGPSLKYGTAGKTTDVTSKIDRLYKKVFRKLKKTFKDSKAEAGNCTGVGRELGYMAMEYRETDQSLAEWIGKIPDDFCTGEGMYPPKFQLLKILDGDLPHAVVVVYQGEDPKVIGLYHF